MTDHPDIDELFAAANDDDQTSADVEADTDVAAEADDEADGAPSDDEPIDGEDDEDLLALVGEAASRDEPSGDPPSDEELAPPDDGGGLILQFPSLDFPPPPVFRLRVPPGWLAVPVPDALMAVRTPDEVDGFHSNVLVRARRVMAAADPGAALVELAALETVPEGMELVGDGLAPEGATPARWVEIRFAGPDGVVLRARHLLVYVPATVHVAHVLSVVGTWPDGAPAERAREVTDIVGSLRLFHPHADR